MFFIIYIITLFKLFILNGSQGDGTLYESFKKPIFGVNEAKYIKTLESAAKENFEKKFSEYPLWSLQFDSFMHGGHDSANCLRKGLCYPIGQKSVWSMLETPQKGDGRDIVILTSVIDSTGFIPTLSPGNSNVIGTTILVAMQNMFSKMKINFSQCKKELVFAHITGETFGYAGSRKFVEDLKTFKCRKEKDGECKDPFSVDAHIENLEWERVKTVIDFSQISSLNSSNLFLHHSLIDTDSDDILKAFDGVAKNVKLEDREKLSLPPSTVHAFIRENDKIQGVVIADYEKEFSNKHYHSEFDIVKYDSKEIVDLVKKLSKSVLKYIGYETPEGVDVDKFVENLIKSLWQCLAVSYDCPMIKAILGTTPQSTEPQKYTSIFGSEPEYYTVSIEAKFLQSFLGSFGAAETETECSQDKPCEKGVCVLKDIPDIYYSETKTRAENDQPEKMVCKNPEVSLHDAISPSFYYEDNEWKVKKGESGAFTESKYCCFVFCFFVLFCFYLNWDLLL